MRKIFDFALICVIVTAVVYACSEDYFAPYEENLELNAHDPRLELIAEIDSAKLQLSSVETLSNGESINSGGKSINLDTYQSYKGGSPLILKTALHVEYYIDDYNCRKITYASAIMPTLHGNIPAGSRFRIIPEIPFCEIIHINRRDDKVVLSAFVTLDYGDFFEREDDEYVGRTYTRTINPFE